MATTTTIPIIQAFNKDLTDYWLLTYKDGKVVWIFGTKPRNYKQIEKKALLLFQKEDPRRNPSRMTLFS